MIVYKIALPNLNKFWNGEIIKYSHLDLSFNSDGKYLTHHELNVLRLNHPFQMKPLYELRCELVEFEISEINRTEL